VTLHRRTLPEHHPGRRGAAPDPTPKEGIANYISQVSQTGLIVVIVITAGAFTVNAAAAVTAYTLGTLAAWYETALLLGSPPAGAMLAGLLCGAIYLIFAVSVAAAATSVARSTIGTVGVTLGILLALPVLGMAGPRRAWLPSTLVAAPIALLGSSTLGDYLPALVIAAIGTPSCSQPPPSNSDAATCDLA